MNSIGIEISKNGITIGAVRYDRRAELLGKTFSPILDSAENTLRTAIDATGYTAGEIHAETYEKKGLFHFGKKKD